MQEISCLGLFWFVCFVFDLVGVQNISLSSINPAQTLMNPQNKRLMH
ncbi:hypothetical protein LDG_5073 [Legionella drancourtii LLAP12]|uniref:Uncharacterized protein n=1 Tax=Legionella drancourtii LLAP12 TaxID=658187 RepID=G9EIR7_9GAMM|nr:hypothetical protein LDG_5073 [Legionella drancourtii LLAP12]